jgi:hypothetical protein
MANYYLSQDQAARFLGISRSSFLRGVESGLIPEPVYPSPRRPRWRIDRLLEALGGAPSVGE